MNAITTYILFFHDGSVTDIHHIDNNIVIFMESSEISPEEGNGSLVLSKDMCIKGKLHLENVHDVKINSNAVNKIEKEYDDGGILNLKITAQEVELAIDWTNYPPKTKEHYFSLIQIKAEKIWWENLPN